MGRAESLEKTLMLGKIEGKRRRGNNNNALEPGSHTHPRVSATTEVTAVRSLCTAARE